MLNIIKWGCHSKAFTLPFNFFQWWREAFLNQDHGLKAVQGEKHPWECGCVCILCRGPHQGGELRRLKGDCKGCYYLNCSIGTLDLHQFCYQSVSADGLRLLLLTLKDSFVVCFLDFSMIVPGLHVKLRCDPVKMGMTLSHCPAMKESAAAVRMSEKPGQWVLGCFRLAKLMVSWTALLRVRSGLVSLSVSANHECCEKCRCLTRILTTVEKAVLKRDFYCVQPWDAKEVYFDSVFGYEYDLPFALLQNMV